MSFKATFLVASTMVILSIVNSVNAASVPLPQWCVCGESWVTRDVCEAVFGNWDGGSCGLNDINFYRNFGTRCEITGGRHAVCWH